MNPNLLLGGFAAVKQHHATLRFASETEDSLLKEQGLPLNANIPKRWWLSFLNLNHMF